MKRIWVVLSVLLALSVAGACAQDGNGKTDSLMNIRLVFGDQEVIVALRDTPASRDFLLLLPLTADFKDFAGAEKIAYLPRRLNTENTPPAREVPGDFSYYAPWGNLAVFYKGMGNDGRLYTLGTIVSGKERLAAMTETFTARIEVIE